MKKNYPLIVIVFMAFVSFNIGHAQSKLAQSSHGAAVLNYLNDQKKIFDLSNNDLADLYVNSEVFSQSSKTTNLYINQRYRGVKIYNAVSSVAVKNGKVVYYANNFFSALDLKVNSISPSVNPRQAILNAVNHFKLSGLTSLIELSVDDNKYVYTTGNVSKDNIPVELVLQPLENGNIRLAWDLSIHTMEGQHWWSVRVDAITGAILDFNDWIVSCNFDDHLNHTHSESIKTKTSSSFNLFKESAIVADGSQYNVFAVPVESPNHGMRTLLTNPANDLASPYGWHDTNGIIGAEYTITRGNNVHAYEDADGAGDVGTSPDGTSTLNFNFPLNLNQAAIGYQNASLTNLFYVNNIMHDIWYQYGFDEASGNFQFDNYGNGGVPLDAVVAIGQDGSGSNNAYFATPSDGFAPEMGMFLWSPPNQNNLVTVNTGSVAGPYFAVNPADGSDNNITGASSTPVTADLVLVNDSSSAPTEGCSAFTNASSVAGKIALIKRGTCPFVDKIQNAQNAGAVGVIVMNHNNPTNDPAYGEYVNMAGFTTPPFTIPSVFINYADGQILANALLSGETLNVTLLQEDPGFQLDGSFDNGIVAHEYGHGISNRLTGGAFDTGCLNSLEQMGEGWSDWFALMLTIRPGDTAATPRGIATFASGENTDGVGIRPTQYSTDFSINAITYGATNDDTVIGTRGGEPFSWNDSVHNIGYIWASALWDLTWAYIDKYGYDTDLYNGTGGNNRVMQLVIDGLKLQPCGPGFVSGRDALLAADQILTGGEDQCLIWGVFANRGVGFGASQGGRANMEDQVESFDMPPATDASLANCTSLSVGENSLNNYKIYPNPTHNDINIIVNKNYGKVKIDMFDINGRKVFSQESNLEGLTNVKFGALQSGIYIMNIQGENININEKIIIK